MASGCVVGTQSLDPPTAIVLERVTPISRSSPVVFLDPGTELGQTGVRVAESSIEAGVSTTVLASETEVTLDFVPRFFDAHGREVLATLAPSRLVVAGETKLLLPIPHESVVDVALSWVEREAPAADRSAVVAQVAVTAAEFSSLEYRAPAGLIPIGAGDPEDTAPKTMGWYHIATGELRYAIEFRILERGHVPIRSDGLTHLTYAPAHATDLVQLPPTSDADAAFATGPERTVVAPIADLVRGPVRIGVIHSTALAFHGARIDHWADGTALGESQRPATVDDAAPYGDSLPTVTGSLSREGYVARASGTIDARELNGHRLETKTIRPESITIGANRVVRGDGSTLYVSVVPARVAEPLLGTIVERGPEPIWPLPSAGTFYATRFDDGGVWFQERPDGPVLRQEAPETIPGTVYPTNGDGDGNCAPGVQPEYAPHGCVVAWIVTGAAGGHPTLGRGAAFPPNSSLGTPSGAAAREIAEGVKAMNAILKQCGMGTQLHLCATHVIDASKIPDEADATKKLSDTLFGPNGVTFADERSTPPKNPVEKLFTTVSQLQPFKPLVEGHKTCSHLFFVRDYQNAAEPDTPNASKQGVGGPLPGKKRAGGVVEGADPRTLAHEMTHGLGHDGHTDVPAKPGVPDSIGPARDEANQRDAAADAAEAEAQRKRDAQRAKDADARRAQDAADEARREAREAEQELEALRQAAYAGCPKVAEYQGNVAEYDRKIAAESNAAARRTAERNRRTWQRKLDEAKEACWKKHEKANPAPVGAAEKKLEDANEARDDAQADAEAEANEAKAAKQETDAAEEAARKAREAADNLMEAAPVGTALTPSQCKLVADAIADARCGCD
jgi:hypothetical protein